MFGQIRFRACYAKSMDRRRGEYLVTFTVTDGRAQDTQTARWTVEVRGKDDN